MTTYYVVNTATLHRLNTAADLAGYNRVLTPDAESKLDPAGLHIVNPVMMHEHAAGKRVEPHARCQVIMKFRDTMVPQIAFLDVALETIDRLPAYDTEAGGGEADV